MNSKEYLGDGVYIDRTEYGEVVLTTEDGTRATNTIIMDGSVLANFEEYLRSIRKDKNAEDQTRT